MMVNSFEDINILCKILL